MRRSKTVFSTLLIAGALVGGTALAAPAASAAISHNDRYYGDYGFVSVAAYSNGRIAAYKTSGAGKNEDVWIDNTGANHVAAGVTSVSFYRITGNPLRFRACGWFREANAPSRDYVGCTPWVWSY